MDLSYYFLCGALVTGKNCEDPPAHYSAKLVRQALKTKVICKVLWECIREFPEVSCGFE